jgi:glycosyltransferase involved in cell wall biosynthesis
VRVAHLMAGAPHGGAELFFERLVMAQHQAGDAVLPVIRTDPGRAARLGAAKPVQLPFGGVFDLATRPRLRSAVAGFAPRVAVAWMNRAARFAPKGDWVLVGRLGGYYDLRYYRHCDHLVGNTRSLARWITAQGWPAAQTHYLPNFAPDLHGAKPERLGIPAGQRIVLALGRLHRNKAFDILIRALPRLPGVNAIIAGEGRERAALETLAQQQGVADRVQFPGWRDDTAALLAGCDALACPSRHEPLGNVVVEAFSAGRPVVAASADGPRELIKPGEDGLLVPIDDVEALATSLRLVLENGSFSARLAEAGRVRYLAEFAEAPVLAQWRGFLETVEKPACAA